MKIQMLSAAFAVCGVMLASSANAAVTVAARQEGNLFGTAVAPNQPLLYGQTMLWDFDAIANPLTLYTGNVLQGPQQASNTASPPYNGSVNGDTTKYASVQAGTTGTYAVTNSAYTLKGFSFYLGSPDSFNTITFNFRNGGSQTLTGSAIINGVPALPTDGDRTKGYRVYYDFGGANVQSITFGTGNTDAFEFDGLAGNLAAVPEPGTWALMIMGFGGAGAMLRRRRVAIAA